MSLKLPPAIMFLIFSGFMFLLAKYLPVGYFDFFGRYLLIKAFVLFAILIAFVALIQFYKARTTIDPSKPTKTTVLITSGVYNYSRNPMYLALLLLLLAWGLWLGNAFNTVLAAGFVAFMNKYQIIPEEKALRKQFGKPYDKYCKFVRRWF